jgi:hypothetical protein
MVVMEIKLPAGPGGSYPDRAVENDGRMGREAVAAHPPICPSAHLPICPVYFRNSSSRYPGMGHSSAEICCCISSP